ncbi:MAG: hypothetical protein EOM08_06365 [Clostridia bacterium]|nr:hypothetical protein [Clostridia bacterium]
MVFIIGGAYQGKLDVARERFGGPDTKVWTCDVQNLELDWSCQVIDKIHQLIWARQQAGLDTLDYLQQHRILLQEKIVICDDLSSGVVPIDRDTRLWRENAGRCSVWLAREAEQVVRVFCGLATDLKV